MSNPESRFIGQRRDDVPAPVDFGEMVESPITIKQAREAIVAAFEEDPHFRYGYQANIAMLIFDDQRVDEQHNNALRSLGIEPTPSADLTTPEGCNVIADRLIKLIFES